MSERQLGQQNYPSAQEIIEAHQAPKNPSVLQRIGRHRLVKPLVHGAATLMILASTVWANDRPMAQAAEQPVVPVFQDREPVRQLNLRPESRTAQASSFDFRTITDMSAPRFTQRCAARATTNPIFRPVVPITDVLLLGRMYVFDDQPEFEQIAIDNNYVGLMDTYLSSAADFWRYFYGIQISHRVQTTFIRPGNFWNGTQRVYSTIEALGDRGLQVAPVSADRPGQYIVPFDVFLADAGYPYVTGRPLGSFGQVIYSKGLVFYGVTDSRMANSYHEIGHTFGKLHRDADPNDVMHTISSELPLRLSAGSADENCPLLAFRNNIPISPRVASLR